MMPFFFFFTLKTMTLMKLPIAAPRNPTQIAGNITDIVYEVMVSKET